MKHQSEPSNGRQSEALSQDLDQSQDSTPLQISPSDPATVVIQLTVSWACQRLRSHEEGAKNGDAEGIHRVRTSTRRLRGALQVFRDLLDPDWSDALGIELKWLADKLGAVRDLDVLTTRLAASAGELETPLSPLFASLGKRHATAMADLRIALSSKRYKALTKQLEAASEGPLFNDAAHQECALALPPLVETDWRRLKKLARALDAESPDADFHEVRKRAKRARYAAEAVGIALNPQNAKAAARFARLATRVQDVLGEHQDAVVACGDVMRAVEGHLSNGPLNFAAGRLLEKQAEAARVSRAKFFPAWQRLDRKKNRRWLKV